MRLSLPRVVIALFALAFVAAACASDTGSQWTFAPVTAESEATDTTTPAAESVTQEETGEADPAEAVEADGEPAPEEPVDTTDAAEPEEPAQPEAPVQPAVASGEPRVIALQADSALRFTDPSGQQVSDIPVTPGETVIFEINNTAGFAHNFYIGTDAELMSPNATTDVGIPDWNTGVERLEWVVPEDITDLKFGCTVPGHYTLMQGTFSIDTSAPAPAPAENAAAEEPVAEEPAPEEPAAAPPATASGEPRVIDLVAEAALRFTDPSGEQLREIPVTPGETVVFRVDNTAGFAHNFYIGTDAELSVPSATTDVGIPDWDSGVQEVEWVVPEDITDLKFGCTVPGHYTLMQGTFSIDESAPPPAEEPAAAEPAAEEPAAAEPAAEEPAAEGSAADESADGEPAAEQAAAASGEPRVIDLVADAALRFTDPSGEQLRDIPVTPGETVVFRVDNTAGFAHNFYIGTDAELMSPNASTDDGIPDWNTGVQELEWVVPEDITDLKFGCTVPGHYTLMQGTFSVSP
jgi:uncharacterized cupredoxin-like copper-binding protein